MSAHRVVVVTGASAGIGRATAIAFGREGASVALLARNREALDATAAEVEHAGGHALAWVADVADPQAVAAAADETERVLGPIDVWVNNAMVTVFAPVHRVTAAEYRRVTEVNYLGAVHGTLEALARMRPRRRGVIVQVGSALAYRPIPLQSAYCAAKCALRGFTDALRVELMHDRVGVRVTMVQLAAFNTPQFDWARTRMPHRAQPVPPIFQPEMAARAIVWAAKHPRRELHVGWPAVKAIWANKLLPRVADRVLARRGYAAQQASSPPTALAKAGNLFVSPGEGHAAHGRFDGRAQAGSAQLWWTLRRRWLLPLCLLAAAGVFAATLGVQ